MRVFRNLAVVRWCVVAAVALGVAGCALTGRGGVPATGPASGSLGCEPQAGLPSQALGYLWQQGTLVIDFQSAAAVGDCLLRPPGASAWPERIALRVSPGAFAAIEVGADQRLVIPVAPGAGPAVDLVLPHALHSPATPEIRLRWGSAVGALPVASPR